MISAPLDFVHEVHVGFDSETQEFSGLPDTWRSLLKISGTYGDCHHALGSSRLPPLTTVDRSGC